MSRLCLLLFLASLLSQPADARERGKERRDRHELRRDLDEDSGSSAAAAARLAVEANGGGRVLSVDREDGGYRVKVLKDGEVRTHHITFE